ncbi:cytochrome c [Candidimonas sp. SYP-B2681]|nr:cytochrome c [Candidimonas sp. SYP-B2681]
MLATPKTVAAQPVAPATKEMQRIERGKYLAIAGDCIACHTAPSGKPMAGGLPLATPIGNIVSTNITPSKTAGIGNYTLEQFSDALRKGKRADGQHLYPVMPYTAYALVSDEDVAAMYAYFMKGVEPVDTRPAGAKLPFPFNIRESMVGWNLLFLNQGTFVPSPDQNEVWNRGAYLARGLTHCTTCHTPRNALMAEDLSKELSGGNVGLWYAPNITSDPNSGIGGWSTPELVEYMRTGHIAKGQASGPMAEAIDHSLQYLTNSDLEAIAVYLKTVPAVRDASDTQPVYAWGKATDDLNSVRGVRMPDDPDKMTGPQLYNVHCATCHQAQAQGSFDGGLPALYQNTALGRTNTDNLVMVILDGIHRVRPDSAEVLMPGFRDVLSNQQLATLATYLTRTYGHPEAEVSVNKVRSLRDGGERSTTLIWAARGGLIAGVLVLLALLYLITQRRRRR